MPRRRALGRTRRSPASTSTRRKSRPPRAMSTFPIVGDCKAVLEQLLDGDQGQGERRTTTRRGGRSWQKARQRSAAAAGANKYAEDGDIHPVRMLEEVRIFAKRDAILCVDGQETLNYRPPDDADIRAGASFELRSVRHDGRRPAVRRRRQSRLSRQAGDRGAWRRLAWA